jgi:hypothetical protein
MQKKHNFYYNKDILENNEKTLPPPPRGSRAEPAPAGPGRPAPAAAAGAMKYSQL